jgi:hypothetical protein
MFCVAFLDFCQFLDRTNSLKKAHEQWQVRFRIVANVDEHCRHHLRARANTREDIIKYGVKKLMLNAFGGSMNEWISGLSTPSGVLSGAFIFDSVHWTRGKCLNTIGTLGRFCKLEL